MYAYRTGEATHVGGKHQKNNESENANQNNNQDRTIVRELKFDGEPSGWLIAVVDGVSGSSCASHSAEWIKDQLNRNKFKNDLTTNTIDCLTRYWRNLHREYQKHCMEVLREDDSNGSSSGYDDGVLAFIMQEEEFLERAQASSQTSSGKEADDVIRKEHLSKVQEYLKQVQDDHESIADWEVDKVTLEALRNSKACVGVVCVIRDEATAFWVGDTPMYLIRKGELPDKRPGELIWRPHEGSRPGEVTKCFHAPEIPLLCERLQALEVGFKSLLTNSGPDKSIRRIEELISMPDVRQFTMNIGDVIVITSDGVNPELRQRPSENPENGNANESSNYKICLSQLRQMFGDQQFEGKMGREKEETFQDRVCSELVESATRDAWSDDASIVVCQRIE